jgi:hypothetical protein
VLAVRRMTGVPVRFCEVSLTPSCCLVASLVCIVFVQWPCSVDGVCNVSSAHVGASVVIP